MLGISDFIYLFSMIRLDKPGPEKEVDKTFLVSIVSLFIYRLLKKFEQLKVKVVLIITL